MRALFTFEARQSYRSFQVVSVNPALPTLLYSSSMNKYALPSLDAVGFRLGIRLANPHGGTHLKVVVGGGPTDLVGVHSAEAIFTTAGLVASERLEMSIATLFAGGRTMEFVKLFGWFEGAAELPYPSSDEWSLVGSGPAPGVVTNDDRCIVQYQIDGEYEVVDGIERVVRQWSHDLRAVETESALLSLATLVKVPSGSAGVFRLRVGGLPDFADGELVVELTVPSTTGAWENHLAQGFFVNPGALVLVKLTGYVSAGSGPARIRGATVTALEAT